MRRRATPDDAHAAPPERLSGSPSKSMIRKPSVGDQYLAQVVVAVGADDLGRRRERIDHVDRVGDPWTRGRAGASPASPLATSSAAARCR